MPALMLRAQMSRICELIPEALCFQQRRYFVVGVTVVKCVLKSAWSSAISPLAVGRFSHTCFLFEGEAQEWICMCVASVIVS